MCHPFFVTFYICDWFHCCTSSLLMASWHPDFLLMASNPSLQRSKAWRRVPTEGCQQGNNIVASPIISVSCMFVCFQLSLFNFYQFHKRLELRWFRTACLLRPNWWFVPMLKWWFVLLDLREDKLHCTIPRSGSLVKSMCNYFGVYIYSINNIYGLQEAKYRILNFWSCLYEYAWSAR